jgi:hypothetical protein
MRQNSTIPSLPSERLINAYEPVVLELLILSDRVAFCADDRD